MASEEKRLTISLIDLLPKSWIDADGKMGVMQSVYACLFFSPAQLNKPYLVGKIDDVFYLVSETELGYTSANPTFKGFSGGAPLFEMNIEQKVAPRSTYIVFFIKYKDGGEIKESEALAKLESARGLVNSLEGHNATYLHMFNQTLVLPAGPVSATSPVFINPMSFPRPFVNPDRVATVGASLSGLDISIQKRVMLALRWVDKADSETDPLDAFLKIWFALEALAMPDTTNIKPLVETLANVYQKPYDDAAEFFKIGRLASLRADIVHNGAVRAIHQQLQNYIRSIFVDVLLFITKQAPEKRAEAVLSDTTFAHKDWRP